MLRYVALVSRSGRKDLASYADGASFAGWPVALAAPGVVAWSCVEPSSRLKVATFDGSCTFGRAFAGDWGAYVRLAVEPSGWLRLERDPTGRIECWRYALTPDVDLIFSHIGDVTRLLPELEVDWAFIAYHLHNDWCRGAATGLAGIEEVLPGQRLRYGHGRRDSGWSWRADTFTTETYGDRSEAGAAIRAAAEAGVAAWASVYDRIALDLSGGVDSAVVLGLLRGCKAADAVTGVNFVLSRVEADERAYARAAANLHGVELIEAQVPEISFADATPFAGRLLRPTNRTMPLGYDELSSEIARRLGADAFMTGTAGDHLFFDAVDAEPVADFVRGHGLSPYVWPVAYDIAKLSRDTVWNVLGAAARDLRTPKSLEARLRRENPLLGPVARAGVDYARFAHPWVTDPSPQTPPAKRTQIALITELQRHYWRYGRADVSEETHPLFSQPLMEACLRTPSYWFGVGGMRRGFQRQIFADLLPESIRVRRTKGANTAHWVSLFNRNLDHVRGLLLEGELQERGLLDRSALEQALQPLALAAGRELMPLVRCLTAEMWVQGVRPSPAVRSRPRAAAVA
jgi:asparagine synthase (glutamine-hydrolysing)